MEKSNSQRPLKEIVELFKGEYNKPTKAWVWAKAIKEWASVLIGIFVVLIVSGVFILPLFYEYNKESARTRKATATLTPHLKEIMSYIDIGKRSMEARGQILKALMEFASISSEGASSQTTIEKQVSLLSSLSKECKASRKAFLSALGSVKNPRLNAELSSSFEKVIDDGSFFHQDRPKAIGFEEESKEWGELCALCENAAIRAQNELAQLNAVK